MNTPNKISLTRILLIPFIVFFYLATFIPYGKLVAAIIFVIACWTDFLDGYLARKNNQVTTLGKFFDTIADKVLIMTGMVLLLSFPVAAGKSIFNNLQWLGVTCVIIMLSREFIISALRQIAAAKGVVLAAEKIGKVKALIQDITISLYMFYAFFVVEFYNPLNKTLDTLNTVFAIVLMVGLVVATVLTIISGAHYLIKNKKAFVEEGENKAEEPEVVVEAAGEAEESGEARQEESETDETADLPEEAEENPEDKDGKGTEN